MVFAILQKKGSFHSCAQAVELASRWSENLKEEVNILKQIGISPVRLIALTDCLHCTMIHLVNCSPVKFAKRWKLHRTSNADYTTLASAGQDFVFFEALQCFDQRVFPMSQYCGINRFV